MVEQNSNYTFLVACCHSSFISDFLLSGPFSEAELFLENHLKGFPFFFSQLVNIDIF